MKKIEFSIILPCLNELKNLKILIPQLNRLFKKESYEIIIVDDNSSDGTIKFFKKHKKKNNFIKLFPRKTNPSLAKSIYLGIKNSKGRNLVVMDSDCNHRVRDLGKMVKIFKRKNLDFVCGSRFAKNGASNNILRHFLSYTFNKIVNIILKGNINDNLSGFFVFNKEKLLQLKLKHVFRGYGEYFIRLLYYSQKENYSYLEIGVKYDKRIHGYSKSKFIKMFFNYLIVCINLRNEKN